MGLLQLYVYVVEYYIRIRHLLNCRRNDIANSATIYIYNTYKYNVPLSYIVCDLARCGVFGKT